MKEREKTVVGIVERNGEVLVGKLKTDDPSKHTWHLPSGKVLIGESCEAALKRNVFEEAGINIRIGSLLEKTVQEGIKVEWYLCVPENPSELLTPGQNLDEVRYLERSEALDRLDEKTRDSYPPMVILRLTGA